MQQFQEYLRAEGASEHTMRAYARDLKQFVDFISDRREITDWDQVEPVDIRAFMAKGMKGLKKSTLSRKLMSLRGFFGFLHKRLDYPTDPSRMVRPPKQEKPLPKRLSVDEAFHMLDSPRTQRRNYGPEEVREAAQARDLAMLEVLYSSGLRVSELVSLDLEHLRLDLELVHVQKGKGGKERYVPLGQRADRALRAYLELRPLLLSEKAPAQEPVFLNRRGGRLSQRAVQQLVDEKSLDLDVGRKVGPHTLRHAMATHLLEGGGRSAQRTGDVGPQKSFHHPKVHPFERGSFAQSVRFSPSPGQGSPGSGPRRIGGWCFAGQAGCEIPTRTTHPGQA